MHSDILEVRTCGSLWKELWGPFLIISSGFLYGAGGVFFKLLTNQGINVLSICLIRKVIEFFIAAVQIKYKKEKWYEEGKELPLFFLSLVIVCAMLSAYYSFALSNVGTFFIHSFFFTVFLLADIV